MLVYVMPGNTPPTPLVLINELNALRFREPITRIRLRTGDESENSQVARNWAKARNIPVTNRGIPNAIIVTTDLTGPEGVPDISKDHDQLWRQARQEEPDHSILTFLRYLTRYKKTIWVNTGHAAYARMTHNQEASKQPR